MFGVSFAEQVVDAAADLPVFVDPVGTVEREHAEARTLVVILADHVALVLIDTVLRSNHPPQCAGAPVVFAIGQAQTCVQRRHLWQGRTVAAVLAPGVSQGRIGLPVVGEVVRGAKFTAHDPRVDVLGARSAHAHHSRGVVEEDVVAHHADVPRGPGLKIGTLVVHAEIQLGGLFRFDRVERIDRAGRSGFRRKQLPVIREALCMANTGVERGRAVGQIMLVAHEAARQGVGAGVIGGRIGPGHHSRTAGLAVILGRCTVNAGAGNQPITVGGVPGHFAEHAVVMEVGVLGVGLILVGVDAHAAALAVFVGLRVETGDQLNVRPAPRCFDPCAKGAAVDIGCHWPRHHAGAGRGAQGVVVHHMVGVVVIDLRFQLFQHVGDVGFFDTQAEAFTQEL